MLLNGNTLTIGNTDNLSSTFSGVIANGSGAGSLIKAGTGTLTLNGNSTYTGGTAIQSGAILLGVNNALPSGTTVTLGTASSNGTLDLRGFSQQVAGLAVGSRCEPGDADDHQQRRDRYAHVRGRRHDLRRGAHR